MCNDGADFDRRTQYRMSVCVLSAAYAHAEPRERILLCVRVSAAMRCSVWRRRCVRTSSTSVPAQNKKQLIPGHRRPETAEKKKKKFIITKVQKACGRLYAHVVQKRCKRIAGGDQGEWKFRRCRRHRHCRSVVYNIALCSYCLSCRESERDEGKRH